MADQTRIPLDYGTMPRKPVWPRIWIVWIGFLIGFGVLLIDRRFTHHLPRSSTRVALPATPRPHPQSAVDAVRTRKADHGGNAYTIVEVDLARAAMFLEDLHCRDALYLDGVISQFYVPSDETQAHDGDYAGILAVIDRK